MATRKIEFGFCVPIFANPGMAFFRTPAYPKLDWDSLKDTVLRCEDLNYDSIFVADHLFLGRDGDIWECMTLMAAFATLTNKIKIIPIHLCNNFRIPSVVAKMLSTLSHVSKDRIELFYDYGWRQAEFDAYGIDFCDSDEERIKQMAEGLCIIKGMLEENNFSFQGEYYSVSNAICNPRPTKKIPIWMGEANNAEMVSNIVRFADVFNSMPCSLSGFDKKLNIIRQECKKQNREFNSLGLSLETQVLIREEEAEIDQLFNHFKKLKELNNSYDDDILKQLAATNPAMSGYDSKEDFADEFMIGTPQGVKKKIDQFIDKGVSHFMLWFMDFPDKKGIDLFADTIIPQYR